MGSVQQNLDEELRMRSEKTQNKKTKFRESLRVPGLARTTLKQSSTKPLFSAKAYKGYIAAVGFHLSAAMVGICLGLLALWIMGYVVLSFSSR